MAFTISGGKIWQMDSASRTTVLSTQFFSPALTLIYRTKGKKKKP
jgi:hypothetical protein